LALRGVLERKSQEIEDSRDRKTSRKLFSKKFLVEEIGMIAYWTLILWRLSMGQHHDLDVKPIPERVLYVNEAGLADETYQYMESNDSGDMDQEDNVRIYVPVDLNAEAILHRLRYIISRYEEANEDNESSFSADVSTLFKQVEIYDQVWTARRPADVIGDDDSEFAGAGLHSLRAVELVRQFVEELEAIPDGCAECFPFEMIDELREEYRL